MAQQRYVERTGGVITGDHFQPQPGVAEEMMLDTDQEFIDYRLSLAVVSPEAQIQSTHTAVYSGILYAARLADPNLTIEDFEAGWLVSLEADALRLLSEKKA